MLKSAFNLVAKIHSRQALLKRLGTVDIYSPITITPSNYFRFLRGPEHTTISGKEFIIPLDSFKGQFAQILSFDDVPTSGQFTLTYGALTTSQIAFDAVAADVQTAIRALTGFSNVTVTGNFTDGFTIVFVGLSVNQDLPTITHTLDVTPSAEHTYSEWSSHKPQKGDRIVDGSNLIAIDEIIDIHDLGATVMGWRVRGD